MGRMVRMAVTTKRAQGAKVARADGSERPSIARARRSRRLLVTSVLIMAVMTELTALARSSPPPSLSGHQKLPSPSGRHRHTSVTQYLQLSVQPSGDVGEHLSAHDVPVPPVRGRLVLLEGEQQLPADLAESDSALEGVVLHAGRGKRGASAATNGKKRWREPDNWGADGSVGPVAAAQRCKS